jgi:OHCU decarboxylase
MADFPIPLHDVNRMDEDAFVETFGDVAEHAPWVAAEAAKLRPFLSPDAMTAAFIDAVERADEKRQRALLLAHPDLAGKAAIAGDLTKESRNEQAGAGLDKLTPEEFDRFTKMNAAYRDRHGIPFIVAVRGATKHDIFRGFQGRLGNPPDVEFKAALGEVARIIRFRIEDRVTAMSDTERIGMRAQAMIDALATITAEEGKLTRLYLTPEHKRAATLVGEWMRRAGLVVRMDAAGTMHGLLAAGRDGPRAKKRLLVGSHIDTVVDAGRFDGNLGVVAGVLAVEELRARGIALPFQLEILAFGDEEGVRYSKTLSTSSAIAGVVEPSVLDLVDASGTTMRAALAEFGGDPDHITSEAYPRADVLGYLEVHIEQGPVLERAGEALGIVSAIASQGRYRLHVRGEAGHAGTVPMDMRHDALAGAAEVIAFAEEIARKGEKTSLVATVGEIKVTPGASNVIPGTAELSLDVRAADDATRTAAATEIRQQTRQIGARRGLVIGMEAVHEKPVAVTAPRLKKAIATAIAGVIGKRPREMMSGAGHDGQAMIRLTDIGMIFVRCRAGISHNPLEYVSPADMGLAIEALVRTIVEIAGEEGK